jgi:hypothetical protein
VKRHGQEAPRPYRLLIVGSEAGRRREVQTTVEAAPSPYRRTIPSRSSNRALVRRVSRAPPSFDDATVVFEKTLEIRVLHEERHDRQRPQLRGERQIRGGKPGLYSTASNTSFHIQESQDLFTLRGSNARPIRRPASRTRTFGSSAAAGSFS